MHNLPLKVLLVEDDEDDYILTRDLLNEAEAERFDLEWAATYEAGLQAIGRSDHDVCLIDSRLGERDGTDLVRDARAQGCRVPLILLTGRGDHAADVNADAAGDDYLEKGRFDAVFLEHTIRHAVERWHQDELLRQSEERYRLIAELASDYIYEVRIDADGSQVTEWATDAFSRITGYAPDEVNSLGGWINIIHPDDLPRVQEFGRQIDANCAGVIEYRIETKQGDLRWLRDHSGPQWDSREQRVTRAYGAVRDITERKHAEDALQQSHHELEQRVEERTTELVKVLARERAIGRVRAHILAMRQIPELRSEFENNWVEELRTLGVPVHSVSLQLPAAQAGYFVDGWDILLGEDNPQAYPVADFVWLQEAWESGEPVVVSPEVFTGAHAKSTTHSLVEIPLREGGSVGVNSLVPDAFDPDTVWILQLFAELLAEGLRSVRDFEALRSAEKALTEQAEELKRSNAELEQFAYVASHDLQEPLRVVTNYVQLLDRRNESLDERSRHFIERSVAACGRMKRLIDDLLLFSRVTRKGGEFAPTDCAEVVRDALDNLALSIQESGAEVTTGELPTVTAERRQLLQLFQNLIGNAIKFRADLPPEIHVDAQHKGNEWTFSVRDNGIGIDPEQGERIFRIFQRLHTREEYTGTGIGLAVCKKIVERHGGRIWMTPNASAGATFSFTLQCS